MASTQLKSYKKGLQLLYRGKFDQKWKEHILKGKSTLTDYKRLLILQKVGHRLNFTDSVQKITDRGKRLQKSDIDHKGLLIDYKSWT